MCGIAGQLAFSGAAVDTDLLRRMSERLAHRGPDGSGMYADGPVGLAHRRLSIIDLSPDGHQPMTNEDGTLWLVYNGEIYNHPELREHLAALGHRFSSRTDSEVVLHAYEEWGCDCLRHFNGMWAFALWDAENETLFCARDRFGIKPLYYALKEGHLLFASEIKALLEDPDIGCRPNETALMTFLAWGVADHSEETLFEGIYQVPPAHYMTATASGAEQPVQYWDLSMNPEPYAAAGSDAGAAEGLLSLLHDSVRLRLRSDVPVGTCLSGGIDSSTITALINRIISSEAVDAVGERQKTFSACYEDGRFDESRFMDVIIDATGVDARRTSPDPAQLWDDIGSLLYMQDEPFGSLSVYAQYCVMRLARDGVKVVLDGQGADEQLGGYLAYQVPYVRTLLSHLCLSSAVQEVLGSMRHHQGFFTGALRQVLIRSGRRALLRGDAPEVHRYQGSLDEVLKKETLSTNLPLLLHWEDRNSMAFSIEARVPFLDHRVVEYLAALPLSQKIRGGVTKYVLRKAIRGLVPEAIRCRMDKMGFVTPEELWMKNEFRHPVSELLESPKFASRPYWDAGAVRKNYQDFVDGNAGYSFELWRIICTEFWLRRFFDNRESL